jgi:predicted AAA+ superfamily ATPase
MNADINNSNSIIEVNKSDLLIEQFDVKNGILGIKRDRFLLLLRHMSFENADNKTRNV